MTPDESDIERRERLARIWRTSAPADAEVGALREHLSRRYRPRARRSPAKVIAVAIVQGLTLGGVTLAAAAWVTGVAPPRFGHRDPVSVEAPAGVLPKGVARAVAPSVGDVPEPSREPLPTAAFDDVTPGDGVARAVPALEDETRRHRAEPKTPSPDRNAGRAPSTASVASSAVALPPARAADGPWTRVADALSTRDYGRAEQALRELGSSADPATRDAAELAGAELRIANGQGGSLRPDVERLAQSGATALIRKRAAKLLDRLP